jgi:tagatose-1,6-bisphosphate aldolase
VILSNGVASESLGAAVDSTCIGWASGFPVGRAIWADTVKSTNPKEIYSSR